MLKKEKNYWTAMLDYRFHTGQRRLKARERLISMASDETGLVQKAAQRALLDQDNLRVIPRKRAGA